MPYIWTRLRSGAGVRLETVVHPQTEWVVVEEAFSCGAEGGPFQAVDSSHQRGAHWKGEEAHLLSCEHSAQISCPWGVGARKAHNQEGVVRRQGEEEECPLVVRMQGEDTGEDLVPFPWEAAAHEASGDEGPSCQGISLLALRNGYGDPGWGGVCLRDGSEEMMTRDSTQDEGEASIVIHLLEAIASWKPILPRHQHFETHLSQIYLQHT